MDEDVIDELARAHALRMRLVTRIEKLNKQVARTNAQLADADALVNELRARASAGALGLDRRAA